MSCFTLVNCGFRRRSRGSPQRARLLAALRDHRVARARRARPPLERSLDALAQRSRLPAVGDLDQHVPGVRARRGVARARRECEHAPRRTRRESSSKALNTSPIRSCRQPSRSSIARARRCRCRSRPSRWPRLRKQAQHRGGDDAERALRADEQLLQVVAGVVLAQASQAVPDAPVGQDHLQARAPGRARCRSAARSRRRRWWRGCRRSGSCPRRRALSGNRRPALVGARPARRRARSRPRRSSCR